MDASDRAALATACAVASSCVVAGETVDAGDVAAATLAIRANAFTVRTRRASPASFSNPDPESRAPTRRGTRSRGTYVLVDGFWTRGAR